jgi:hypothetical protein
VCEAVRYQPPATTNPAPRPTIPVTAALALPVRRIPMIATTSAPPVQLTAHATVLLCRARTNRPTATDRTTVVTRIEQIGGVSDVSLA